MKKVIPYGESLDENLILALGYFDAVHCGHTIVLNRAVALAKDNGLAPACLIFVGKKSKKDVFTLSERVRKIFMLGIEIIIVKELDDDFMQKSETKFLDEIKDFYNPKKVVCGSDFTFGYKKCGNVSTLKGYFSSENVCAVTLLEDNNGEKISSSTIKKHLEIGDIKTANQMLGSNYFICGEVVKGKGLGKDLNFPTANIILDATKFEIKQGVYVTFVIIDDKIYPSITNFGNQPTVDCENKVLETHIKGYNGNLYGKFITVYFVEYLRDIQKFTSVEKLKEQLIKDLGSI